jgi:inner membrane transporter RhtA
MFQVKKADVTARIPPHVYFFVSAIFHYLGPAFAVLLFSSVSVLGVAWFRIASAAVVFALWRQPWRFFVGISWAQRRILLTLGVVLALMNACFYLAISRLPLGTVGAIEFLGPITLAALGARTPRNIGALLLAAAGGWLLTDVRFGGSRLGLCSLLRTVPSSCCMWSLAIGSPRMEVQRALIGWAQRCSLRS